MSTNKGCAPGKSSLIGLGSARDYDGCAILQTISGVAWHHVVLSYFVDRGRRTYLSGLGIEKVILQSQEQ